MALRNPVVVIPGLMGTTPPYEYPVDRETIWSVLRNDERRRAQRTARRDAAEPDRWVEKRV